MARPALRDPAPGLTLVRDLRQGRPAAHPPLVDQGVSEVPEQHLGRHHPAPSEPAVWEWWARSRRIEAIASSSLTMSR